MSGGKNKLPPVSINPEKAVVGQFVLVLVDGEHTYHISLDSLFRTAAMPMLVTLYQRFRHEQNPAVMERINLTKERE